MKNSYLYILIMATALASGQKNLVRNGGFEGNTDNWRGEGVILNSFDKQDGSSSGMINQFTGAQWKGIDQVVSVPKDCYAIDFGIWIKADNIEGGKDPWNAGVMTVELLTSGERSIRYENIAQVVGSTGWVYYHKTVILPSEARKFRVMLALAQTNGSVLVDNVTAIGYNVGDFERKIEEERKAAKIAAQSFHNGGFEAGVEGWRGTAQIEHLSPKEGQSCVSMSSAEPIWKGIDQPAYIPEGSRKVHISGWLRANKIVKGKDSWNNGVFIVELTKDGTAKVTDDQLIGSVVGETEWTFFEKEITLPSDAAQFRIMLALSNATGTLLADDIKVEFMP